MKNGQQKCSICEKYKPLSNFRKYTKGGFRKSFCYLCEKERQEKPLRDIGIESTKRPKLIAEVMRDVTVAKIQDKNINPLSEVEVGQKLKIMFGGKIEFCPFCKTWKETKEFAEPVKDNLFVSRPICKSCDEEQKILSDIVHKPIVKIQEEKIFIEKKEENMKVCKVCKKAKKLTEYYPRKNKPGYTPPECKECAKEAARNRVAQIKKEALNKETPKKDIFVQFAETEKKTEKAPATQKVTHMFTETEKYCPSCGLWKKRDRFWGDKKAASGLYLYCKECAATPKKPIKVKPVKIETVPAPVEVKNCKVCGLSYPLTEFHTLTKDNVTLYSKECKKCVPVLGKAEKVKCSLCEKAVKVSDIFMYTKTADHHFCKPCSNIIALRLEKQEQASKASIPEPFVEVTISAKRQPRPPKKPVYQQPRLEEALL